MKKNYICPVVEVNAFDFEDVVMTSSYSVKAGAADFATNKQKLIDAAKTTGGIVVVWDDEIAE